MMGITKQEFYDIVEPMREEGVWTKDNGTWYLNDSVDRHEIGKAEEKARVEQAADRSLSQQNRHFFYNPEYPPEPIGNKDFDEKPRRFRVL